MAPVQTNLNELLYSKQNPVLSSSNCKNVIHLEVSKNTLYGHISSNLSSMYQENIYNTITQSLYKSPKVTESDNSEKKQTIN